LNDALVERLVVSVVNVANGGSPVEHLPFLEPSGDFLVSESDDAPDLTLIDPASYRRYDLLTTVVTSIDTEGAARLYRGMKPLFDESYLELGLGEESFDAPLARAIQTLVDVPIPTGSIAVERDVTTYEFVDPALERLTRAQKHILRLGPDNASRVQMKLRQLAAAIGLQITDGR